MKIKAAIIDDYKEHVELLCEYITEYHRDITPVGFYSSKDAKKELLKSYDFDIVITDHVMPYLEGDKLVGAVTDKYRPFIILITCLYNNRIIREVPYYDYKLYKPIKFDELNRIINIVKRDIYFLRDNKVNDKTEEIFDTKCSLKEKSFFQRIIKAILYDEEAKGRVYDTLTNQLDRDKSTVRKHLNSIVENLDNKSFDKLGFVTRPKNIEFLSKFVDLVEKELIEEKKVAKK